MAQKEISVWDIIPPPNAEKGSSFAKKLCPAYWRLFLSEKKWELPLLNINNGILLGFFLQGYWGFAAAVLCIAYGLWLWVVK